MKSIFKSLGISEKQNDLTKPVPKQKAFNKVKENIPHVKNYNFMADLLMLPTAKSKNRYLLVVDDLASDNFDIEPLKTKEPKEVLSAFKIMFTRPYIKKPYASIRTDDGNEFKGVFAKWLHDESILHKIAISGRHKQLSNVENLNKQLGRLLNGYMNSKEEELGHVFKEWDDKKILDTIRKDFNKLRKKSTDDPHTAEYDVPEVVEPKYKVGDIVYRISEFPLSALGHKQNTDKFRAGDYRYDIVPRKVIKILSYSGKPATRYFLDFLPNVSYSDNELKLAHGAQEVEKFVVKEIIGKQIIKKKVYYLVWWKNYLKKDATLEPKDELMKDVPDLIAQYESSH
jgi:hypothetical protein